MKDSRSRTLHIPELQVQPVSVTRQMAAALPKLKQLAKDRGLTLHYLGAGYPHPEVSDPRAYISRKRDYFSHLATKRGISQKTLMTELYSYGDTLGPYKVRKAFADIYGRDFNFTIDPDLLIPTIGATGGIGIMCSLFERTGQKIAYIVDAPTYTGLLSRASLYQRAKFYSVTLDCEGPDPDSLGEQIELARADGNLVAFYYTIPDGHNPAGISFTQERRIQLLEVAREKNLLIVEDAPYTYISFEDSSNRPDPLIALDSQQVVHLFTASKIGFPGPRVGMMYTESSLTVEGKRSILLKDLLLTESSGSVLFHNPEALRGFEAHLTNENFEFRRSLWPVAAKKNKVYAENREILLQSLKDYLGKYPDYFSWTKPGAGFFSVFTFMKNQVRTDHEFIEKLVAKYGVVTIPMFGFYSEDARKRNPDVGLNQLRLSFSYSEHLGAQRCQDLREAVRTFANAARIESGLPGL